MNLVAQNLSRHFGDAAAVKNVTFGVAKGEVVGLLGHNGAGKSTTMRMLAGALVPSSGRAYLGSDDSTTVEARRHLGWLPETPPLTAELTVEEQLNFAAALKRLRRAEVARVISQCDLSDLRKSLISTLSKGTKQRVGLAQALLGNPAILLLDEPTAGLDPTQAAAFRALVRELSSERAVLLSTHLLHDVAALCSRAVLMRDGAIVADVKIDELRAKGSLEEAVLGLLAGEAAPS